MNLTPITDHVLIADGATVTAIYREGDDCVVIDSGHPRDGDDLIRLLGENNLHVRGILSTHYHHDHFGNCRRMAKLYGLPVIMPLGEAGFCRSPQALAESFQYCSAQNINKIVIDTVVGPVDETIGFDQKDITIAGMRFDVIHAPGHTPDNVAFRTPDGVLVIGDVLITPEMLAPLRAPYTTCVSQDLMSKKLVAETPCTYCVMAHRGYVPASKLPEILRVNIAAYAEIISVLRGIITRPMSMDEIVTRFCHARGINGTTITRSVQMHHIVSGFVGYLIEQGEVRPEGVSGVTCYIPAAWRGNVAETAGGGKSGAVGAAGGEKSGTVGTAGGEKSGTVGTAGGGIAKDNSGKKSSSAPFTR